MAGPMRWWSPHLQMDPAPKKGQYTRPGVVSEHAGGWEAQARLGPRPREELVYGGHGPTSAFTAAMRPASAQ